MVYLSEKVSKLLVNTSYCTVRHSIRAPVLLFLSMSRSFLRIIVLSVRNVTDVKCYTVQEMRPKNLLLDVFSRTPRVPFEVNTSCDFNLNLGKRPLYSNSRSPTFSQTRGTTERMFFWVVALPINLKVPT